MIFLPYNINNIFGVMPLRVSLSILYIAIIFFDRLFLGAPHKKSKLLPILLFIIFILLVSVSIFVAPSVLTALYTLIKFVVYGIVAYTIMTSDFSKVEYKNILTVFICASAFIIIYGIFSYVFGFNLNVNGIYKYPGAKGRVYTTFTNPIYYGIFCVIILNLLQYVLYEWDLSIHLKITTIILILLVIINVYLTYTRSAYILAFMSIMFVILLNLKNIKNNIVILMATVLFLVLIPGSFYVVDSAILQLIPNRVLELLGKTRPTEDDIILSNDNDYEIKNPSENNVNSEDDINGDNGSNNTSNKNLVVDVSMMTRSEFHKIAYRVIKDNFFLGVGFGNYENFLMISDNYNKYISGKFGYPHNNFLHILAETGLMSLIVFVCLQIYFIGYCFINGVILKQKGYIYILLTLSSVFLLCFYESFFYNSQIVPIYIIFELLLFNFLSNKKSISKER